MLQSLINLLGGGIIQEISGQIQEVHLEKIKAKTKEEVLKHEERLAFLEAQRAILLAEQRKWYTAWIRPALAFPVVVYVWKLLIWDTVLQWGVTPYPGEFISWIVVTVIGAYMLTRPFERR